MSTVITWISTVVTALVGGDLADLLPLLAIGVAISAFMLGSQGAIAEGKLGKIGENLLEKIPREDNRLRKAIVPCRA